MDVQNALIAVRQARAQYQAAEKSRILQEQTLDAEQKKYALGASTVFLVIQAQRDLATAEGARVQALAAYSLARTQMNLVTGQILDVNNVQIDEARKGAISTPPKPIPVLDNPAIPELRDARSHAWSATAVTVRSQTCKKYEKMTLQEFISVNFTLQLDG